MSKIEKEILSLEAEIRFHQDLYYVKNKPTISDFEFDLLFKKLQTLEEKYPEFASINSPTKIVGSDLDNSFEKFTHKIPVLSLTNTYNSGELSEWLLKTGIDEEYSLEWKIDGASIVLYYENGKLEKAVTRGSGGVGDDVTENIRTIKNIPLILKEKITMYLRGEVYMGFTDFEKFNNLHDGKYANPRNLSAGSIKHKHSSQVSKRPLKIFTYDGFFPDGYGKIKTHAEMLDFMRAQNLPVSADTINLKGKDIVKKIDEFKLKKETLDFPTDGLVIKLNRFDLRDNLGNTAHSPRYARAFKFDALMKESTIINIDFAIGRTGKITPRAEIEPVSLAGTTVRFATLHNQDYINELGVGIGARVLVAKRGEIIPAVEEVIESGKQGVFQLPNNCPCCGTVLFNVDDSVDKFCLNLECPDREKNLLIFFSARKQMDIEGLGEKQIENLYDLGFIKKIPDLYTLNKRKTELEVLEGFGKKSVGIILEGIEKSKQKDLLLLLPSLGFSEIGHKVTELLIEHGFDSIEKIIDIAKSKTASEELLNIHGFGERIVESFIKTFKDKSVLKTISSLQKLGLNFSAKKKEKSDQQIFLNQSWCVTGTFEKFQPREKAMDLIVFHGGKKVSSISSKTTHLLAGENAGSKLEKATELGIEIVRELDFLTLLKKNNIAEFNLK
jgi:DNA ligase (NAD+)